jgi:hypothetical protein
MNKMLAASFTQFAQSVKHSCDLPEPLSPYMSVIMPVRTPPPSRASIAFEPVGIVATICIQLIILLHYLLMNLCAKEPFYSSNDFFNRKVIS